MTEMQLEAKNNSWEILKAVFCLLSTIIEVKLGRLVVYINVVIKSTSFT